MSDSTTTAPPAAAAPTPATTAEPSQQSTSAPASSNTTADPGQQSTSAPGTGTTNAAPGAGTTAAPEAGPTVQATIEINPPDNTQNPTSVQVPVGATLTLTWNATGASSVNITGIGDGQAVSGSQSIPTQDGDFTLIAIADGGAQSPPCVVSVATHPDGDVVSGHADIASGVAAVISFTAMKDSQSITSANIGDSVNLVATVSDSTDSCTIGGQSASLSDSGDGNKQASVTITITAPMSGDFDCEVSAAGTAGAPSSIHLGIGAAPPGVTTTLAPGFTTTLAPGGTTTAAPAGTTTAAVCVETTTAAPAPTTTAAHPPSTTTAALYTTIWNNSMNLNLPKIDGGDHFSVTLGISFVGTLECKTNGAQPVSDLPGDWIQKLEDGFTSKFTLPLWTAYFNGGTWQPKTYGDFWSHFTFYDSSQAKTGGFNAKTELTTNLATYDVGEYDFNTSGGITAAQAKFAVSVAQVNSVDVLKSALGVATGSYSIIIANDVITDGDYKLTGQYAIVGQIEIKGPSAEEIIEKIAENPAVIEGVAYGAAAVLPAAIAGAIIVAYVWAEMQIESVDVAAALPPRVANAGRDGVQSAFEGNSIESWSDNGGDLTSYFLSAKQSALNWLGSNPSATDDDKAKAQSDFVGATTSWANTAVFAAYKADGGHPAELVNEVHQRIFGTPDPDYKGPAPEGGAP